MKKKVNISVVDIINKVHSPKNAVINNKNTSKACPLNSPIVVDKPIRFEDLYKKVVEEHNKNGDQSSLKVIYESKKTTPINTQRAKKHSATNSILNNSKTVQPSAVNSGRKSSVPNIASISPSSRPLKRNSKQSLSPTAKRQQKQRLAKKQKQNIKISESYSKNSSARKQAFSDKFEQGLRHLNHEQHSHIRQRNQCFLSQRQIQHLMKQLGYNVHNKNNNKYADLLQLLQVDIYGGTPSENLKTILSLIESEGTKHSQANCKIVSNNYCYRRQLPKVVDNNLTLVLTQENKQFIRHYFQSLKLNQMREKQNTPIIANLSQKPIHTFQSLLKQRSLNCFHEKLQEKGLYSPGKKINSTAISQLIEALSQSEKKNQEEKLLAKLQISSKKLNQPDDCFEENEGSCQKCPQKQKSNMETFRKIEANGFETEENQYNFSRELSGQQILQQKQDENILELKNKLNEALKKSSIEANQYFAQDRQYSGFIYSNPVKYGRKPILSVDVNLGEGISEKIIVFEGQTAKQVSQRLACKFTISSETKQKFEKMLESHLNTMLWKIDQVSQQMLTDRDPE